MLFKKLVIQKVRVYERYESCLSNIAPFRFPFSMDKKKRELYALAQVNYLNQHGKIKNKLLIYRNKCNYNTRMFKEVLANGIY